MLFKTRETFMIKNYHLFSPLCLWKNNNYSSSWTYPLFFLHFLSFLFDFSSSHLWIYVYIYLCIYCTKIYLYFNKYLFIFIYNVCVCIHKWDNGKNVSLSCSLKSKYLKFFLRISFWSMNYLEVWKVISPGWRHRLFLTSLPSEEELTTLQEQDNTERILECGTEAEAPPAH